jgi:hypothetical protein
VLPFAAGSHPGTGGRFTILTFPDAGTGDAVYVETIGLSQAERQGALPRRYDRDD